MKRLLVFLAVVCLGLAAAAPSVLAASSPLKVSGKSPSGLLTGKGEHYFVLKSGTTNKWTNTKMRWCSIDSLMQNAACTVHFFIYRNSNGDTWPSYGDYVDTFTSGTVNNPGWHSIAPNVTSNKNQTWSWWSWKWGSSTDYAVTPTI